MRLVWMARLADEQNLKVRSVGREKMPAEPAGPGTADAIEVVPEAPR